MTDAGAPGDVARQQAARLYAETEADVARYVRAMEVAGVDGELALLRARLQEYVRDDGADIALIARVARLIAQMVAARYRMSRADEEARGVVSEERLAAIRHDVPLTGGGAPVAPVEVSDEAP
jgi:hypothetical protein